MMKIGEKDYNDNIVSYQENIGEKLVSLKEILSKLEEDIQYYDLTFENLVYETNECLK